MSDAVQPTAAQVRAAADALKAAVDRHLAAVERRAAAPGAAEADAAVFAAFNELAAAGEVYDELLYDVYDEVTPFEVPETEGGVPYAGPEEPEALSVFIRRDYTVVEPKRLLAQAKRIADLDPEAGDLALADTDVEDGPARGLQPALGVLFGEFDPDELASRHKEFGLEEGDATVWVTVSDEPAEPGEWLAAPFDAVDPERVVCRFDISEAFEEDDPDNVG
ncbi:hypothetical protein [Streptomyces sp. NPDC127098]|uniref:hypothetical protein n=1 Tax=Streptomyces sp. NPDC127098 TaxID=3347137 RepID=UPI003662BA7A